MNHFFSVDYRMSRGNMHIDLQGHFDASAAKQFISFLSLYYKGKGRVFVDTAKLNTLTENGIGYFKKHFSSTALFVENLYLKGEQGLGMMPQGSRLILMKSGQNSGTSSKLAPLVKKHCSGNCKTCTCSHEKEKKKIQGNTISYAFSKK